MENSIEIRKAEISDIQAIQNITKKAFEKYVKDAGIKVKMDALSETDADITEDLNAKDIFIAIINGVPVGSIRVEISQDKTAFISRFGVTPENQKNGIGRSLMAFVDNFLITKQVKRVCLYTASKHTELICFYYRMGFHVDSTTRDSGYIRAYMVKEYGA